MQNVVQLQPVRAQSFQFDSRRYGTCVEVSRRVRWDIDRDVIRGRSFELSKKFLPDGMSLVNRLTFMGEAEQRRLSQIQGRTYANMLVTAERFISAKMLEMSREYWLGDQTALEALVRFTDEELKHQELFRRIERMIGAEMPGGYRFATRPDDAAWLVLGKSTWAVLALTCMFELLTQAHYGESIAYDPGVSDLYRDVFLFHWKEESQHVVIDELEWRREDARLTPKERDEDVEDLIALLGTLGAVVEQQAKADADYFVSTSKRRLSCAEAARVQATLLRAYRWQYVLSGVQQARFADLLAEMVTEEQGARIGAALLPLVDASHTGEGS